MCDALRELFADELKEREMIGLKQGLEQGLEQGEMGRLIAQIKRKKEKGQSPRRIAEDLMEPVEEVEKIYGLIQGCPGCDIKFVCDALKGL